MLLRAWQPPKEGEGGVGGGFRACWERSWDAMLAWVANMGRSVKRKWLGIIRTFSSGAWVSMLYLGAMMPGSSSSSTSEAGAGKNFAIWIYPCDTIRLQGGRTLPRSLVSSSI